MLYEDKYKIENKSNCNQEFFLKSRFIKKKSLDDKIKIDKDFIQSPIISAKEYEDCFF